MTDRDRPKEPADVLLVEDNPGDVRLTKEAFADGSIANTLHVVGDGVDALDFLNQRGGYADAPEPSIVLLDLNLPRKDGDEVLEAVKADPELAHIPVVVLTSSSSREDVIASYERNANAYLTKPVDPDEFIETVEQFERFWLSIVELRDD
ncbi:response regulator [Halobaculum sp. D14]|uniref:response regulator n=1 Tax=Halobaculum sp. D14 TaxID=3421642 RepID=UPI003EB8F064